VHELRYARMAAESFSPAPASPTPPPAAMSRTDALVEFAIEPRPACGRGRPCVWIQRLEAGAPASWSKSRI